MVYIAVGTRSERARASQWCPGDSEIVAKEEGMCSAHLVPWAPSGLHQHPAVSTNRRLNQLQRAAHCSHCDGDDDEETRFRYKVEVVKTQTEVSLKACRCHRHLCGLIFRTR